MLLTLYAFFLTIIVFFSYKLSAVLIIGLPLSVIPLICLIILLKYKKKSPYLCITFFFTLIIIVLQIHFFHSYLAPEFFIEPTTAAFFDNPAQIVNPINTMYGVNIDFHYLFNNFSRFWSSILTIISPILFILSLSVFISFNKYRENFSLYIFPLIYSVLLTVFLPQNVFWYGSVFPDRFLIAPICFLIILSARAIRLISSIRKKE